MRMPQTHQKQGRWLLVPLAAALVMSSGFTNSQSGKSSHQVDAEEPSASVLSIQEVQPTRELPSISKETWEDAETYAAQHGEDINVVANQMRGQTEFSRIVQQLKLDHPDTYVTEMWDTSPWIALTQPLTNNEIAKLREFGVSFEVRVVNAVPKARLDAATKAVYSAASQRWGAENVTASAHPATAQILLEVSGPAAIQKADRLDLSAIGRTWGASIYVHLEHSAESGGFDTRFTRSVTAPQR